MKKSYTQLLKQIETLQAEASKLRQQEIAGVVAKIREAIDHYGLTAADLGLSLAPAAKQAPAKKARKAAAKRKGKAAPAGAAVRYRDEAGNTWVGRGKRPQWVRDALAAGKTLEDLAVK